MSDDGQIAEDLTRILAVARAISAEKDLDRLLDLIVRETTALIHADRSTIFLVDEDTDELYSKIAEGENTREIRFPRHAGIAGHVATTGEVVNIPNAYKDARFNQEIDKKTGYRTRNILCCPLLTHDDRIIGVVQVLNKAGGPFTKRDEELILATGSYAAVSLDNAHLVQHYLAKQRIEQSLRLANEIQNGLYPKEGLIQGDISIQGWHRTCDAIGGDYYDYFPMESGSIGLVIGDVSGHGIGPALLMASTRATLRGLSVNEMPPQDLLTRLNAMICTELGDERFVTLFYGIIDPTGSWLSYASAGHDPPLHCSGGGVSELEATGVPLGVMDDMEYDPGEKVQLCAGDLLLFGTDGIWEAANSEDEAFGRERLIASARKHMHEPTDKLIQGIVSDLEDFLGKEPVHDDLTLVVVRKGVS